MYDRRGVYLRQYPIVNLTLRTGFFDVDDNIDYMTQGSFRQLTAAADYIVDPDVSVVKCLLLLYMNTYADVRDPERYIVFQFT